mmetsp:Transcript_2710/g.7956  ORF Transcript_2710/g.7956 Transcript_2710/m.7956 type:complete len:140 (-) Transcript_2710:21-440(-)
MVARGEINARVPAANRALTLPSVLSAVLSAEAVTSSALVDVARASLAEIKRIDAEMPAPAAVGDAGLGADGRASPVRGRLLRDSTFLMLLEYRVIIEVENATKCALRSDNLFWTFLAPSLVHVLADEVRERWRENVGFL